MQIVQLLAGFSKGEADVVRKGMGKKKQEIIEAEGKIFIDGDERFPGCVGNGYDRDKAIALWTKMSDFGKYASTLGAINVNPITQGCAAA